MAVVDDTGGRIEFVTFPAREGATCAEARCKEPVSKSTAFYCAEHEAGHRMRVPITRIDPHPPVND
ncbi:MAG: hypothetical protein M3P11_10805 [Actinomycetota bacterium]|nr:hypothetical protein [Actinomycetota bacterium]